MPRKTKFIVVVGSIMSGLGKGIVTSSIGKLLQARGYKVVPIKFDGYLNVDCGTMNPFRHGEVFVLDDGTEVDMDFGTYERFLNYSLDGNSSITGGKIFRTITEKERKGDFLGRDVQFVPHLTDEIKRRVKKAGEIHDADIVLIEVGGTAGDLENGYFLEAMRQLNFELPPEDLIFIQLTYVPSLFKGEQKTKPTQHATRLLQGYGIQPEIIICREEEKLGTEARKKISDYCNVREEAVFDDPMVETVYQLPLIFEKEGMYESLSRYLLLDKSKNAELSKWESLVGKITGPSKRKVRIGIVGKYTAVKDAYVSVKEALVHSAVANDCGVEIEWIESAELDDSEKTGPRLHDLDGIIVPGGYGKRGIEGKINAVRYARENKVPFLGLCLGMQMMVIEYARNVCGLENANSTEFDEDTGYPVIALLPEQEKISLMGGTNRLGAYECRLKKGTCAYEAYGKELIFERHRHRFEVNPEYVDKLKDAGLVVSGTHPESDIVEIVEWRESFGIASQAHLELKSRLEEPAPVFRAFVKAALEKNGEKED